MIIPTKFVQDKPLKLWLYIKGIALFALAAISLGIMLVVLFLRHIVLGAFNLLAGKGV